ncbi:MAG: hypothetical protein VX727_07365 [Planctomycetota bacterium]|nr:hypothetical protein [Planctomycetota bacterium]
MMRSPGISGMLSELLKRKRELMGWTGLAAVAVGLLFQDAALELRIFLIAAGLALVALALPRSVWARFRTWWTAD